MNGFGYLISKFFSSYLTYERNYSQNTISSYRDTFVVLFKFMEIEKGIKLSDLSVVDLDNKTIRYFLIWLKDVQKNRSSTIINRLAAIKSFFKFLQLEDLKFFEQSQLILAIKGPKKDHRSVDYLSIEHVKLLLDQIENDTFYGRRDLALLSLMFDSGARVQEIIDLKAGAIKFDKLPSIKLFGKGRKERIVILLHPEINQVKKYMDEINLLHQQNLNTHVFKNKWNRQFTRAGINYILKKYAKMANQKDSTFPLNISCHSLRHSKAMALLRQGIPLIYIRDQLGHSSIKTTEIYARADSEHKRKSIESAYIEIHKNEVPKWEINPSLLDFLKRL